MPPQHPKPAVPAAPGKLLYLVGPDAAGRREMAALAAAVPGATVGGEAANPRLARSAFRTTRPALVLVDTPDEPDEAVRWIRELGRARQLPIAVYGPTADAALAERLLRAGAAGVLLKGDPPEALAGGIASLLSGEFYVSPRIGIGLARTYIFGGAGAGLEARLSKREDEILRLLGLGLGTRDIAKNLHISARTVEAHRWHIKQKLNLRRPQTLLSYAMRRARRG